MSVIDCKFTFFIVNPQLFLLLTRNSFMLVFTKRRCAIAYDIGHPVFGHSRTTASLSIRFRLIADAAKLFRNFIH